MKLGVLTSHGGSLIQSAVIAGVDLKVIICNNRNANAFHRATELDVPAVHLSNTTHPDADALDQAINDTLQWHGCDFVLLAGYMKRLGSTTLAAYSGRIINSHPSLLPKFGGKGFYGRRVHEAVINAGETESGITIHFVDGEYDTGKIIQQLTVPIYPNDSAETLEARVKEKEVPFLARVIAELNQTFAT